MTPCNLLVKLLICRKNLLSVPFGRLRMVTADFYKTVVNLYQKLQWLTFDLWKPHISQRFFYFKLVLRLVWWRIHPI